MRAEDRTRERQEPGRNHDGQVLLSAGLVIETDESYVRYLTSWALEDDGVDWAALWTFAPGTPRPQEPSEPPAFAERTAA